VVAARRDADGWDVGRGTWDVLPHQGWDSAVEGVEDGSDNCFGFVAAYQGTADGYFLVDASHADNLGDDYRANAYGGGGDRVQSQGWAASENLFQSTEGGFADYPETGRSGGGTVGGAAELLSIPRQSHRDGGAGTFRILLDGSDYRPVGLAALSLLAQLDHRDGAAIDPHSEAGHCQRLDVADNLFGGFGRRGQHVHFADAVAIMHDADGVDRRQAAKGFFEFSEVHDYVA